MSWSPWTAARSIFAMRASSSAHLRLFRGSKLVCGSSSTISGNGLAPRPSIVSSRNARIKAHRIARSHDVLATRAASICMPCMKLPPICTAFLPSEVCSYVKRSLRWIRPRMSLIRLDRLAIERAVSAATRNRRDLSGLKASAIASRKSCSLRIVAQFSAAAAVSSRALANASNGSSFGQRLFQ